MKYFKILLLLTALGTSTSALEINEITMTEHWEKVTTSQFSSTVLGKAVQKTILTYAIKPSFTKQNTQSSMIVEVINSDALSASDILSDRFNTLRELLRGFQVTMEPEVVLLEGRDVYRAKGERIVSNLLRDSTIEDQDAKLHYYSFSADGKIYVIRYVVAREHWKMNIGISESVRSLIKLSTTTS